MRRKAPRAEQRQQLIEAQEHARRVAEENAKLRQALQRCVEALDRLIREAPMGAGQLQQASMAAGAAQALLGIRRGS